MPLYNINFQESSNSFSKADSKDYAVIIKVPLDSGWLTGKYNSLSSFSDIRKRWSIEDLNRRATLISGIENILDGRISLHHAAFSFILAHPEVTTVIPGIKNESQLESNIKAGK